jgi:tetratricopeptide (TPR) repeat protein
VRVAFALVAVLLAVPLAEAADPPALARARTAYNAANYDQAIVLAEQALTQKADADVAALIVVRSRLERYRLTGNDTDLKAAHATLRAIARQRLKPGEQAELLVAQGLALYLDQNYGGAAEVFGSALARVAPLGLTERDRLLEWWALALDREAQALSDERRRATYSRVADRMEQELRDNPASVPANFWLAAASRGAGNVDRAWDAAMAAWVRVPLDLPGAQTLRQDLDRLIVDAVIPERSRQQPRAEWDTIAAGLRSRWDAFKREWQ